MSTDGRTDDQRWRSEGPSLAAERCGPATWMCPEAVAESPRSSGPASKSKTQPDCSSAVTKVVPAIHGNDDHANVRRPVTRQMNTTSATAESLRDARECRRLRSRRPRTQTPSQSSTPPLDHAVELHEMGFATPKNERLGPRPPVASQRTLKLRQFDAPRRWGAFPLAR